MTHTITEQSGTTVVSPDRNRDRIELILSHLDRLPTLPAVAVRLLAATTSDRSSADDVVRIIESDATLTAAILRLVQRADRGVRLETATVAQAVVLLGFSAVRNAVLSVQIHGTMSSLGASAEGEAFRSEFWTHSLAVACAAEMIAADPRCSAAPDEAFVCGLLHDIGKIALDACMPKSYARVVDRVKRQRECICDAERAMFGIDHTVAGKRLATHWRLPRSIIDCVWLHHHDPNGLPPALIGSKLVQVVHLADHVVRSRRIGFSGYNHTSSFEELAAGLGVDAEALNRIANRLPERMERYCELVGLDDLDASDICAKSLAAANQELGRINAELAGANRQLEIRAKCFDAIDSFTRSLGAHKGVAEVCAAAGEAIRAMVDGDRALAYVRSPGGQYVYIGRSMPSSRHDGCSIMDVGTTSDAPSAHDPAAPPVAAGFARCSGWQSELWTRVFEKPAARVIHALPIGAPGEIGVGAVLVSAPDPRISLFRNANAECTALTMAIGLAVATAASRTDLERTNEELLDVNRRLHETQRQLVRARSISMIGEMAAGAAHELNNPLAVISGRAQMLHADCADAAAAERLHMIIEQAERASQIVTDLMRFAKPEAPTPMSHGLADALAEACQRWRTRSSLRDEQIVLSLPAPDVNVYVDPLQLDTILDAIIANAIEATSPETALIKINSSSESSDDTIRIQVEDNGVGMAPDVLERALDPFFSDRPAGRGRGLGLSRAYRYAEINGGCLWLESTPNIGTTVTIELPARQSG